ncbi:MAG: TrkA family potassium uptake protein, partial [Dehalococcoidia bacterium]|nr:TrkA family potassium uptake protein [Dehalococcoidia bacterium]
AKGKYLIVGLGRFGYSVAQTLNDAGEDVLAIDIDEDRVQEASETLNNVIVASGSDERVLRSLGVTAADRAIISCGESLENSILSCAVMRQIGLAEIICKAISETHADILRRVGATHVVNPERDMAIRLANSLIHPDVLEHVRLAKDHTIIEIIAPKFLVGETLVSSNLRAQFGIHVLSVAAAQDDSKAKSSKAPDFEIP